MKQLTIGDYEDILNYFEKNILNNKLIFKSAYINEYEFKELSIKDNLFNYRCVFYANTDFSNLICIRLFKKPSNFCGGELIYIGNICENQIIQNLDRIFEDVSINFSLNKVSINILNECISEELEKILKATKFSLEVKYKNEFGKGKDVYTYSKFLN